MANVNNVSNSYSSIYGSRNVLSGLASGLDTESMIENSVSGYKTKITQLQQQMESMTWKQDAYRSITDKMIALLDKFTSYTSKTNLASSSFFSQAVRTIISGTYASKVSATGKSSSDVQINKVEQLATAAKYTVSGSKVAAAANGTGEAIDWDKTFSSINGSTMTIQAGEGTPVTLSFDANDKYETADDLAKGINEKLAAQGVTNITATAENGAITFTSTEADEDGEVQAVSITGVTGTLKDMVETGEDGSSSFTVDEEALAKNQTMVDYLSGKSISVTYNGTTKSISLKDLAKNVEDGTDYTQALAKTIQDGVDSAFGKGRVTVSGEGGKLSFDVAANSGSTLKVTSGAKELGLGSGVSNYLDTSKTLGDLLGEDAFKDGAQKFVINGVTIGSYGANTKLSTILSDINNNSKAGVKASFSSLTNEFVFTTTATGADQKIEFGEGLASKLFKGDISPKSQTLGDLFGDSIEWDENGNAGLGVTLPTGFQYRAEFNKNDSLEDLLSKIGTQGDIIHYDENTGEYSLKKMSDGSDYPEDMARSLMIGQSEGSGMSFFDLVKSANTDHNFTPGQDAILTATINGKEMSMTRSSNTVDIDGLSVTLKGEFDTKPGEEAVSFKTTSDSDKVVDAVKDFVDQYNALLKEIHDAYSTQPLYDSSGKKYSALTEDDKSSMSDNAIERYEEKAKTGLLFGDSDLSSLYTKMTSIFTSALSGIGVTATYSGGLTQISLDEDKLRETLENDPDKVKDAFTSSKALGGGSDGLMTRVKDLFNAYASKSIASPGVLVRKAGTKLSSYSLSNNEIQKQIDQLQSKIDSWQTKLNKKIDYYTRQFTTLESLMSTMNNQSSMLSGLMGGY